MAIPNFFIRFIFYMNYFFKGSCSNEVALAAWSKELTKDRSKVKEVINSWVITSQVCEQLSAGQNFSIKHPPLLQTIQETAVAHRLGSS